DDPVLDFVRALLGEEALDEFPALALAQRRLGIDLVLLPVQPQFGRPLERLLVEVEVAVAEHPVDLADDRRQGGKVVKELVAEDERERIAPKGEMIGVATDPRR